MCGGLAFPRLVARRKRDVATRVEVKRDRVAEILAPCAVARNLGDARWWWCVCVWGTEHSVKSGHAVLRSAAVALWWDRCVTVGRGQRKPWRMRTLTGAV